MILHHNHFKLQVPPPQRFTFMSLLKELWSKLVEEMPRVDLPTQRKCAQRFRLSKTDRFWYYNQWVKAKTRPKFLQWSPTTQSLPQWWLRHQFHRPSSPSKTACGEQNNNLSPPPEEANKLLTSLVNLPLATKREIQTSGRKSREDSNRNCYTT